jgi:hypothetical protein
MSLIIQSLSKFPGCKRLTFLLDQTKELLLYNFSTPSFSDKINTRASFSLINFLSKIMAIIFRKSIKIGKEAKYFLVILLGVIFALSFFILGYKLGIQKSTQARKNLLADVEVYQRKLC